ncbi:MAG: MFS transporter [Pseudomonadota bacterium]
MTGPLSRTIISTYGLAFLGVHLAFMPLLVLLLPRRVEMLAGENAASVLSLLLLIGGVVAGIANIIAGAVSDKWYARFGTRRGLIAIGAGLIGVAYIGFAMAGTIPALFAALVFFQLALNCCFAPLVAVMADHIPDQQKGRMAGLLNAALPASTLLIVPIAWLFPRDNLYAFGVVGVLALGCIVPLLVTWGFGQIVAGGAGDEASQALAVGDDAGAAGAAVAAGVDATADTDGRDGSGLAGSIIADFARAWIARLAIQTGAAFVIGYIYIYIAQAPGAAQRWSGVNPSEVLAILTAPSAVLAIAAAVLSGAVSDLRGARRVPLFCAALVFGGGLALLASAPQPLVFILAYGLFQVGLAAFLAIDTALVAQLVAGNRRRGLLLGVMNLSNTLPAIIAPTVALVALGGQGVADVLGAIFAVMALAALGGGALMLTIVRVR